MGKIWLQRPNGQIIWLPITGEDVNSPNDLVKIPTSVISFPTDRCLSDNPSIPISGHGTVTFDFAAPGRSGSCNQCGICCGHPSGECPSPPGVTCGFNSGVINEWHICQHLVINKKNKWGNPNNTSCAMRDNILDYCKTCILWPLYQDNIYLRVKTACGFSFN